MSGCPAFGGVVCLANLAVGLPADGSISVRGRASHILGGRGGVLGCTWGVLLTRIKSAGDILVLFGRYSNRKLRHANVCFRFVLLFVRSSFAAGHWSGRPSGYLIRPSHGTLRSVGCSTGALYSRGTALGPRPGHQLAFSKPSLLLLSPCRKITGIRRSQVQISCRKLAVSTGNFYSFSFLNPS